jgi:hypothetical protein
LDDNLVYSFHLYSGSTCNPLDNWQQRILTFIQGPILDKVKNQTVPLWLGEYAGHCADWIQLVHSIMKSNGVDHTSYYSPKCASDIYDNSKCMSRMNNSDRWKSLLINTRDGLLISDWETDPGFNQLEHSNFSYDQAKLNALFP